MHRTLSANKRYKYSNRNKKRVRENIFLSNLQQAMKQPELQTITC